MKKLQLNTMSLHKIDRIKFEKCHFFFDSSCSALRSFVVKFHLLQLIVVSQFILATWFTCFLLTNKRWCVWDHALWHHCRLFHIILFVIVTPKRRFIILVNVLGLWISAKLTSGLRMRNVNAFISLIENIWLMEWQWYFHLLRHSCVSYKQLSWKLKQ